ncbi:MAG TPA: hypothetical protein VH643_21250 [Gemmataceae bacterium]|jgi:hypothetical protein
MFVPHSRPPCQSKGDLPDYLSADDLAGDLDDATLAQLAQQCEHVALDGGPCWPAEELLAQLECLSPACPI